MTSAEKHNIMINLDNYVNMDNWDKTVWDCFYHLTVNKYASSELFSLASEITNKYLYYNSITSSFDIALQELTVLQYQSLISTIRKILLRRFIVQLSIRLFQYCDNRDRGIYYLYANYNKYTIRPLLRLC